MNSIDNCDKSNKHNDVTAYKNYNCLIVLSSLQKGKKQINDFRLITRFSN